MPVYGSNPNSYDRNNAQAVGCTSYGGELYKYAMAAPVISGTDLTSVNAEVDQTSGQWIVDFNVKSGPAAKLGTLTEQMATQYYSTGSTEPDEPGRIPRAARGGARRPDPVLTPGPGPDHDLG